MKKHGNEARQRCFGTIPGITSGVKGRNVTRVINWSETFPSRTQPLKHRPLHKLVAKEFANETGRPFGPWRKGGKLFLQLLFIFIGIAIQLLNPTTLSLSSDFILLVLG